MFKKIICEMWVKWILFIYQHFFNNQEDQVSVRKLA